MHVSILFPTWHRPYLALYEQVLYGMIQQIASLWPAGAIRDQYVAAASNFRIPYWDWAAVPPSGESSFPASIGGSPTMTVNGPNGLQSIANPLFTYQFKPLDATQLPDTPVRLKKAKSIFKIIHLLFQILTGHLVRFVSNNDEMADRATKRIFSLAKQPRGRCPRQ